MGTLHISIPFAGEESLFKKAYVCTENGMVTGNGTDTEFDTEAVYYTKFYLVRTDDGRYYVYACTTGYSDHTSTDVYALTGTKPIHIGSYDAPSDGFCSPDSFYVTSRVDLLDTHFGCRCQQRRNSGG